MKSIILLICFVSASIGGWAQESKKEKKDSLPPIVIEGTLKGVPPETVVMVSDREGGLNLY